MSTMFVDTPALNIRSKPTVASDTLIGTVFLGQRLKDVKAAIAAGWVSCSAELNGVETTGFASEKFLRSPLSGNREKLVASVHREWMRFARGNGKEHHEPYYKYVGEMWQAIRINLDGTDRDTPWSGAAISFMVRNAGGAYAKFKFAAAHTGRDPLVLKLFAIPIRVVAGFPDAAAPACSARADRAPSAAKAPS